MSEFYSQPGSEAPPVANGNDRSAALNDIARCASDVIGVPVAHVTEIGESHRTIFTNTARGIASRLPSDGFCMHAISYGGLFVVEDARQDPRFAELPAVTSASGVRFYAGVPLTCPEGRSIGTLCVFDVVPRQIDAEKRSALCALADCAAHLIVEQRRSLLEIFDLRNALEQAETACRAKMLILADTCREMRTPLNAIVGFAQLLECDHEVNAVEIATYSRCILDCTQPALELTSSALRIASDTSATSPPYGHRGHLRRVLNQVVASVSQEMEAAGVHMSYHPPIGEAPLAADDFVLRQVVLILMKAALERTPNGGRIHFSVREDNEAVMLEVTGESLSNSSGGTGGMPASSDAVGGNLPALDVGFRGDLSLVKHLVDLLGGALLVGSTNSVRFEATAWFRPSDQAAGTGGKRASAAAATISHPSE